MPYLVDTNILIRICDRSSLDHAACRDALVELLRRDEPCHSCAQTLIEFWVVATRPREANGLGLTSAEARADLIDFQQLLPCLPEPPDLIARWQHLVIGYDVRGRRAYDARLVALMQAHGLTRVLTLNVADFTLYTDLAVVTPASLLAEPA